MKDLTEAELPSSSQEGKEMLTGKPKFCMNKQKDGGTTSIGNK